MIESKALESIPRFIGLAPEALSWLAERAHRVSVKAGQFIFFDGDECNHLYILESGSARVFKSLESGREITLDLFFSGEALGEVALIDGIPFPANALAHEDCSVIKINRQDYFSFLKTFPDASLTVIRDLSLRMRSLNRRLQ